VIDSVASDQISYTDPYFTSGIMTYYIEVVRYAPCAPSLKSGEFESVISNSMTSAPLGISEKNSSAPILIFPNPAHQQINVVTASAPFTGGHIYIYSLQGAVCADQNLSKQRSELDISELPRGMYFLKVVDKEGIHSGKFVKE
jgi:hypothetical protein